MNESTSYTIQVLENTQVQYVYVSPNSPNISNTDLAHQHIRGECSTKLKEQSSIYRTIVPNKLHNLTFNLALNAQLELQLDLTNYPSDLELTLKFNLMGPGASVKLVSRARLTNTQKVQIRTAQRHLAPNTTSDLLLKTICFDQAQWSYHGTIYVAPEAHNTVASQLNHNLLVHRPANLNASIPSPVSQTHPLGMASNFAVGELYRTTALSGPQAYSIPALEVLTNDVRCTHGSAVGQIDQDSLVYLMARGLTPDQAEEQLLTSFLG